ncbi:DNA-binding domain-containing protein [Oceanospirillum maris]|uniref:HvfC/BufC N-terminal domain-containing protein n=1 Tax=Oceanospirillum maris TaxID=64977 RepID=UPI000422901E|nr:DNA-binding domain-containing protein [Oceanospirillum maris]
MTDFASAAADVPPAPELYRLQQQFAQALISPASSVDHPKLYQGIQETHFDADQLLQIYRNNFVLSLTEALEVTFPVLQVMVGDEFFAQLAKAFIRTVPMSNAAVAEFGGALPDFMLDLEQLKEMPYLADLARFEWAYSVRINRIPTTEPFPYQGLSEVGEDDYERIHFMVNPDITLFQSPWAIIELFRRLKNWLERQADAGKGDVLISDDDDPLAGFQLDQPQKGYIATSGLAEVLYQELDDGVFCLLEHCQADKLFSQFEYDAADLLLQDVIRTGLITGFGVLKNAQNKGIEE